MFDDRWISGIISLGICRKIIKVLKITTNIIDTSDASTWRLSFLILQICIFILFCLKDNMHIVPFLIAETLYESGAVVDCFQLQVDAVFGK